MLYPEGRRPKNPWPWGLGLCFAGFISLQIGLVRLASAGFEGPDQVHYYRMGLEHSKELQRQKAQRELGWKLEVAFPESLESGDHRWQTRMLDRQGKPVAGSLILRFKRPATKTQDFQVDANPQAGQLVSEFKLAPGWWVIEFEFQSEHHKWLQHQRCHVHEAHR